MTRLAVCVATLGCLCSSVAHAQITFEAPVGVAMNNIKQGSTEDFEYVMRQVAEALANSDNSDHRAMADGWRLLRSREPAAGGSVMYWWWIDPAPEGADYSVSKLLAEYYPDDAVRLYQLYTGSYAGGIATMNLDPVISFGSPGEAATPRTSPAPRTATGSTADAIQRHCAEKWSSDFRMRAYCETQQEEASAQLRRGAPPDIPPDVFHTIRSGCVDKWGDDYRMREYCESQQYEGYREVR